MHGHTLMPGNLSLAWPFNTRASGCTCQES